MAIPGWEPLIVCGVNKSADPALAQPCGFSHVIELINNIITDLVILSTMLATVALVYVGYILLTSRGNPGAMTKAKDIFMKVVIGYLWILGAWLLVYTISSALLKPEFSFLLGTPK